MSFTKIHLNFWSRNFLEIFKIEKKEDRRKKNNFWASSIVYGVATF